VYAAEVDGQRLTFEVAGVYRRNLITRDRQTGTLWQHATGEALMGPLKGAHLRPLGGELLRWSKWKAMHPRTSLAVEPAGSGGLIPRRLLEDMLQKFTTKHAAPGLVSDTRLPMHEEIVGVSLNGVAKAYPLSLLQDRRMIQDSVGGHPIAILYDGDADHVSAFIRPMHDDNQPLDLLAVNGGLRSADGSMRWTWTGDPLTPHIAPLRKIPLERQWWLGWAEFHPDSDVYA